MWLGAHVGIGGGYSNAVTSGIEIAADAIQIFTRNQMQWKAKPIDEEAAKRFREDFKSSKLKAVVAHGSYLTNLASPEKKGLKTSIDAVLDEIGRCEKLGIGTYIFHPGSHVGAGDEKGEKTEAGVTGTNASASSRGSFSAKTKPFPSPVPASNPVTVSASPPVFLTTGTVPYLMLII